MHFDELLNLVRPKKLDETPIERKELVYMELSFIEKLDDIKSKVHSDLSWWGYMKRNGVPTLWERIPSQTTSFIIVDHSSGTSINTENKMTNHISKELEDRLLYQSYNQYINYLTEEESAIIKARYFRNRNITEMIQEFDKSRAYIKKKIELAIYKIAYQNPNIDFLDIDYDKLQMVYCSHLKLSNQWKESMLRSISFNRSFYKKRIACLPEIMQEKIERRLNKEILTSNDRKIILIALLFIAYILPEDHPLHIDKRTLEAEYHLRTKSDIYLNEFYKKIEMLDKSRDLPVHMVFKNESDTKMILHFNSNEEMNEFFAKNRNIKLLYSQKYSEVKGAK